jgi:mRNA interferase MazF
MNPLRATFPRRGEIVEIVLDPTVGTEIRKTRPCVVVSNDRANEFSPQLTVVPITAYSPKKVAIPVCVEVPAREAQACGLKKRSIINCSQIRAVDKQRVRGTPFGTLPAHLLKQVDDALKIHLALGP